MTRLLVTRDGEGNGEKFPNRRAFQGKDRRPLQRAILFDPRAVATAIRSHIAEYPGEDG